MEGYVGVEEAARISGYTPGYIRQLVKLGKLGDVYKSRHRLLISVRALQDRIKPVRRKSRAARAG